MKKIRLPYRKMIHWFFLFFFGIPLVVFTYSCLQGQKVHLSVKGIQLYIIPTVLTVIGFAPTFTFRPDDKESEAEAWIKIPVLEFYVIMLVGICSFIAFVGILDLLEHSYTEARQVLLISLPATITLLLALNSKRVWFKEQLIPGITKKILAIKYADIGAFIYSDKGFTYAQQQGPFVGNWNEISMIVAWKVDGFVRNTIYMIIRKENGKELCINEDTPGWHIFIEKLPEVLNGIDEIWQLRVIAAPFETSTTLVYEKRKNLMERRERDK